MKNKIIQVVTKFDLEYAIACLEKSGFSIDNKRKNQFIESWENIDAIYGDLFSKTISAIIDVQ